MKRILAMAIIFSLFNMYGFAETPQEIKFRDIPWFTDISSVSKIICADIGYSKDIHIYDNYAISTWDDSFNETDKSGVETTIWCSDYNLTVAGHHVAHINIYGIYGIVNGEVSYDIENTELCLASYVIDGDNQDLVYSDLYSKLCEIYGEPDATPTIFNDMVEWYGLNNTAVRLKKLDGIYSNAVRIEVYPMSSTKFA